MATHGGKKNYKKVIIKRLFFLIEDWLSKSKTFFYHSTKPKKEDFEICKISNVVMTLQPHFYN